jgi:hypothetical protein
MCGVFPARHKRYASHLATHSSLFAPHTLPFTRHACVSVFLFTSRMLQVTRLMSQVATHNFAARNTLLLHTSLLHHYMSCVTQCTSHVMPEQFACTSSVPHDAHEGLSRDLCGRRHSHAYAHVVNNDSCDMRDSFGNKHFTVTFTVHLSMWTEGHTMSIYGWTMFRNIVQ